MSEICKCPICVDSAAQVCKSLRFKGTSVPSGYEQAFQRALWTFNHQTVFCPSAQACVPLRPFPDGGLLSTAQVPLGSSHAAAGGQEGCHEDNEASLSFLGGMLDAATAQGIATGVRQVSPSRTAAAILPSTVLDRLQCS